MALDQISFQFRKIKEEELVIADAFRTSLEKARREIVDRCLDPKDPEYVALLDELKRIFKKKNIEELTSEVNWMTCVRRQKRRITRIRCWRKSTMVM